MGIDICFIYICLQLRVQTVQVFSIQCNSIIYETTALQRLKCLKIDLYPIVITLFLEGGNVFRYDESMYM